MERVDNELTRPVFVYGTLKSKERLHHFLKDQTYVGKATTLDSNFRLKEFANSFPIAFRNTSDECKYKVCGEVYDMQDDEQYANVKLLEENAGYKCVKTIVNLGNHFNEVVEMYVMEEKDIDFGNSALSDNCIRLRNGTQEWSKNYEMDRDSIR